jgi:enamine deaminase RidA (YjgF/YER057c/UK114 family)
VSGGARVIQPDGWPRPAGYANGMAAEGRIVAVAGQVGWDPVTERFATDDMAEQVGQALHNIATVLAAAGAHPEHVVRLTWYVTDLAAYVAARGPIHERYRAIFGRHFPAMSVVEVKGLMEREALVEIEATAVVG